MAISDLTGTTWVLNSTTANPSSTIFATLNFSSNSQSFVALTVYDDMDAEQTIAYRGQGADFPILVYEWGWSSEAYRTISITGGTDVTNATFIAWLEANAEQQQPTVPDVAISYAGAVIASLTDSGTKTLKTQGKYCEDDITIDYTKSGGGGVELATISASGTKTYYTDENMVAHEVNGSLISVNAPVGSIVVRYGMTEPGITDTGITQIATWGSKTTATAVYKVTG